jgi:hypothetical protein
VGFPIFLRFGKRRTTFGGDTGAEFDLLSIPDLVRAKKMQRSKDWPVIELLATIHHRQNGANPRADDIDLWLREVRTPELLAEITRTYPAQTQTLTPQRPLLTLAATGEIDALRLALDSIKSALAGKPLDFAPE